MAFTGDGRTDSEFVTELVCGNRCAALFADGGFVCEAAFSREFDCCCCVQQAKTAIKPTVAKPLAALLKMILIGLSILRFASRPRIANSVARIGCQGGNELLGR